MRRLVLPILFAALAPSWTRGDVVTFIDFPGAALTTAFGINDLGQVVGTYQTPSFEFHAFERDQFGYYSDLAPEGSGYSQAYRITNAGRVLGEYEQSFGGQIQNFVRQVDGTYQVLNSLPGWRGYATDLDDSGRYLGYYTNDSGTHGFLRDASGTMHIIDKPGATRIIPYAMNDSGYIVGTYVNGIYRNPSDIHGFIRSPSGAYYTVPLPWAYESILIQDINADGTIVGSYLGVSNDFSGPWYGFLLRPDGTYVSLDYAAEMGGMTQARSINDLGMIVGNTGFDGFLSIVSDSGIDPPPIIITPNTQELPEPATWLGACLGAVMSLAVFRRRIRSRSV